MSGTREWNFLGIGRRRERKEKGREEGAGVALEMVNLRT